MLKILVPVDGSENSRRAVQYVLGLSKNCNEIELELLNVQPPIVSGEVRTFISDDTIKQYYSEESDKALKPALTLLQDTAIKVNVVKKVGRIAEKIVEHARENACDAIVIGSHGMGAVTSILLGSIAAKVVHLSDKPVTIVK